MTSLPEMVTIGKIGRPFGVRGAVKVRSLSDRPGRFERLQAVSVAVPGGRTVERTVKHLRGAGPFYIVEFEGVNTPEEAGMLRGGLLQVPREIASAQNADAWYECDLIGMTVTDEAGQELGCLEAVWDMPAHHVLVVKREGHEVLIPAVKEFVRAVDVAQGRMIVRTIKGLIEA
jgi:16S rRNA processing protein RimM